MEQEKLNKTIVLTDSEAYKLIEFCKDKDGNLSREFFDWYLDENSFFAKSGMLIIEVGQEKNAVSFDFSNPDSTHFTLYNYKDQTVVSDFVFNRGENESMNNITFDIKLFFAEKFNMNGFRVPQEEVDKLRETTIKIAESEVNKMTKNKNLNQTQINGIKAKALKSSDKFIKEKICQATLRYLIYSTYALMFYASKKEIEEITTQFKASITDKEENDGKKVKTIYRYSGYIDLRDNKTYRINVKKDLNEPIRDYERHIGSWIVRGHYRTIKGKRIWIDEHIKGEGELEKRIYGTKDEADVNIIPKIFEVERTKKIEEVETKKIEVLLPNDEKSIVVNTITPIDAQPEIRKEEQIEHEIGKEELETNKTTIPFHSKPSLWSRVKLIFKKIFS
jgi:hypothetical protein